MALTKAQLLTLIDEDCSQQGAVSIPGPILKELVDNYITEAADIPALVITEQAAIADVVPATVTTELLGDAMNLVLAALRANGIIAA